MESKFKIDGSICGKCKECCKDEDVFLTPEEVKSGIYYHEYDSRYERHKLRKRKNMDCIYLSDKGCSIHDDRPRVCKVFDCRFPERMFGVEMAYRIGLPPRLITKGRAKDKEYPSTINDIHLTMMKAVEDEELNPLMGMLNE